MLSTARRDNDNVPTFSAISIPPRWNPHKHLNRHRIPKKAVHARPEGYLPPISHHLWDACPETPLHELIRREGGVLTFPSLRDIVLSLVGVALALLREPPTVGGFFFLKRAECVATGTRPRRPARS